MARLLNMRGDERVQDKMLSCMSSEHQVSPGSPSASSTQADGCGAKVLSAEFDVLYTDSGRSSIAPEYIRRCQNSTHYCHAQQVFVNLPVDLQK